MKLDVRACHVEHACAAALRSWRRHRHLSLGVILSACIMDATIKTSRWDGHLQRILDAPVKFARRRRVTGYSYSYMNMYSQQYMYEYEYSIHVPGTQYSMMSFNGDKITVPSLLLIQFLSVRVRPNQTHLLTSDVQSYWSILPSFTPSLSHAHTTTIPK